MTLIKELKRRNVFKVAVAYVIVAWLIVQVVNTIVPIILAPDWIAKFVFILLLAGFPIACLFAWAFELTPEGIKRSKEVDPDESICHQTSRYIDYVIIAALLLIIGGLLYNQYFSSSSQKSPPSIAVLPFVNMSSDVEQEYFSDGISEEILNRLTRINELIVSSRTSSFVFKDNDRSIQQIAAALNVNHVLEGSVRKSGSKVRITAQLISVEDDKSVWSNTYERELTDIFAIQDEIAHAIVSSLKITLHPEQLQYSQTNSIEAYSSYLQGKFEFAKRDTNPQALFKAINLFKQAIALDDKYANAYASLGRTYALMMNYGLMVDLNKQKELARAATSKALRLDSSNIGALLSSATIKFQFEGDFIGAKQDFETIIGISAKDAEVYNFYGDYLNTVMDYEKAIEMEAMALKLDPNSYINQSEYGQVLISAGYELQGFKILTALASDNRFTVNKSNINNLPNYFAIRLISANKDHIEQLPNWGLQSQFTDLAVAAKTGDQLALNQLVNTRIYDYSYADIYPLFIANIHFENNNFDLAEIWLKKSLLKGLNYFTFIDLKIVDPRTNIEHPGLKHILSTPPFAKLRNLRRKNLGLSTPE
ncbi:FlgO family outer membrane protein [Thalassotalea nanhaiensis]|uniref:FlgO family outer membrane protein n=1 Tax=Thalassotalea nanhaiensis TaxID=3065648 RepID=A0ABY9TMI4_9GAMM|nr:FlgO family outer membrane protein [Colwelliaceae bacterium SQ345]